MPKPPKDPLAKISELCAAQLMIVQTTGERPCRDEFVALVSMIQKWAEEARAKSADINPHKP
jgi:hypothetical protein